MKFYLVTPNYNSLSWLELCDASVADQVSDNLKVYHYILVGNSNDDTKEWLKSYS